MPTRKIKTWLRQCAPAPAILLLGPVAPVIESCIREAGAQATAVRSGNKKFWPEAMAAVHRVPHGQVLCLFLLPGLYKEERSNLLSCVTSDARVIVDCAQVCTVDDICNNISRAIGLSPPKESTRAKEDKDTTSSITHHRPDGWERLVKDICEISAVNQVRFRKGSGGDNSCSVVGDEIHVHFTARFGLVVQCTTTHPEHLIAIKAKIDQVLLR